MPSITQLQYILALHRHKHFGRAAEECHVSQPSLSAQIQKAEEELGLNLFDRSKKPVRETEDGKKVIEVASQLLDLHKQLYTFAQSDGQLRGHFHLGVIPTLASSVLPLFVEKFSKQHPQLELSISEYKTQDIIRMLKTDELDAGLVVTPLYDEALKEEVLFYEPFYLFVSRGHELAKRKFINEQDLDPQSVWLLEEGHCFRDQVIRVCSLDNKSPVLKNVSFESGSLETLINLVRRGRGYTLLPHLATTSLSSKERKENLKRFHKPAPTREVSLISRRAGLKKDVMRELKESIQSSLPKDLRELKKQTIEIIDI